MKIRLLTSLLLTSAALGAGARTVTLDECVAKAEEHYPEVAQYGLIGATKEFNVTNATKAWLPQANVYAQGTWQNDVMEFPQALTDMLAQQGVNYPGINKLQYKAGVGVEQAIWDGGATTARKEQARAEAEVQTKSVALDLYDVANRVEDLYFSILILDRQIEQLELTRELLDSVKSTVDVRLANGVAMESDRLETEAKTVETNRQIDRLSILRRTYMQALELFVGESMDGAELSEPSAPVIDTEPRLTDQMAQARLQSLAAQEKSVNASLMPRIGAFVNAYYGYPGFNTFKTMTSTNPTFNFLVGVSVNWNIGSLYTRRGQLGLITAQREAVETEQNTLAFNRSVQSLSIRGEIATLQNALETDSRMAELRTQIRMAAQTQYANGVATATTLLAKMTDEQTARMAMTIDRLMIKQAMYKLNRNEHR